MASFGSADNQVHIANQTKENIYILAAPNPDWVWADVAINVAITAATLGIGAGAGAVKTLTALQKAISALKSVR